RSARPPHLHSFPTRRSSDLGPRQDPGSPYSGVISLFATALPAGKQPIIYGDGEQTRDFTYIANVVDGVLKACEAPKVAGEVINIDRKSTRLNSSHLGISYAV